MSANNYDARKAYNERRRKRRRKIIIRQIISVIFTAAVIMGAVTGGIKIYEIQKAKKQLEHVKNLDMPDWVDVQLIHKHGSARSGTAISNINNIVIHYVGNPGTSAKNNRNYFDKDDTQVSSHFIVGLEGEIIQCVPVFEKSAASNWRNKDTISIEVCHPDDLGKFNDATYLSVIKLTAWLCDELGLTEEDVIRHYDITGKICPKYFVENEDEWIKLKKDVGTRLDEYKVKQ